MTEITLTKGQWTQLGKSIFLELSDIRRDGSVRLGIDAAKDVPIWREELVGRVAKGKGSK